MDEGAKIKMKTYSMWDSGNCELELHLDDENRYSGEVRFPDRRGVVFFSFGTIDEAYEYLCVAFLEGALFPKEVLTKLKADKEEQEHKENDRA